MSASDWLLYRRYGRFDDTCVRDGPMIEGGSAMISSVSERELVGETDE